MLYSGGSWTAGSVTFNVRWQDGCFRVVGYDRSMAHRATLDRESVSVNFLTGRMQVVLDNAGAGTDASQVERWSASPGQGRVCV